MRDAGQSRGTAPSSLKSAEPIAGLPRRGSQETAHPPAGDVDLDKYPNSAGHPYTIKPGPLSDKYAVVRLKVTAQVKAPVSGCEADYTQAGQTCHQTLACKFGLDMA